MSHSGDEILATIATDKSAIEYNRIASAMAKNRKGDAGQRRSGRAGRGPESNAEAGSSGGWLPRMAHRGWQALKGTESS